MEEIVVELKVLTKKKMRFQDKQRQVASNASELAKSAKKFRKKRKTKLVRLSEKWHKHVKDMPDESGRTISKRLDRMCELFFKHNPELRVHTSKPTYTKDLLS